MMDAEPGTSPGKSEAAGDRPADEQRTDQSGPGGVGHAVDLPGLGVGFCECRMNQRQEPADVIPRRQLRHDPAVLRHASRTWLCRQWDSRPGPAVVDGRRGLVAGCFDAQNPHFVRSLKLAYVL